MHRREAELDVGGDVASHKVLLYEVTCQQLDGRREFDARRAESGDRRWRGNVRGGKGREGYLSFVLGEC